MLEDHLNQTASPKSLSSSCIIKDESVMKFDTPVKRLTPSEKQNKIKEAA